MLKDNAVEAAALDRRLRADTLSALHAGEGDERALKSFLEDHRQTGDGSALANLSRRPTADNMHEWCFFQTAWQLVLKRSGKWQRKADSMQKDVLLFHFAELKKRYYALLDSDDPRVVTKAIGNGRRSQRPMSTFFWDILKTAHSMSNEQVDRLALRMLGDFHTLSRNPGGRHRVVGSAKSKAKAKAQPKASA